MVCGGNTPPKGPYTEHEPQKRAERGFARPYGIPYGILAVLVEYRTVLNGRAKSGGVLGDRRARDGCSRRPTVESLRPYGGSSCAFANDQSPGKGEPHRRLRSRNLVCSEPWGFQYGLAKSRTENRQVMGCVGNSYGDCRCGPPLPDELQKSWNHISLVFCTFDSSSDCRFPCLVALCPMGVLLSKSSNPSLSASLHDGAFVQSMVNTEYGMSDTSKHHSESNRMLFVLTEVDGVLLCVCSQSMKPYRLSGEELCSDQSFMRRTISRSRTILWKDSMIRQASSFDTA